MPGDATTSACGSSVVADIVRDKTSHVEGLPELAAQDAGYNAAQCNLWLCRGVQFGDNAANVQAYAAGQVVPVKIALTIPHLGSANVSVVDTKTDEIIGEPLVSWPAGYADERQFYGQTLPANQTDFNITIPTTLGDRCATAGDCVSLVFFYFLFFSLVPSSFIGLARFLGVNCVGSRTVQKRTILLT